MIIVILCLGGEYRKSPSPRDRKSLVFMKQSDLVMLQKMRNLRTMYSSSLNHVIYRVAKFKWLYLRIFLETSIYNLLLELVVLREDYSSKIQYSYNAYGMEVFCLFRKNLEFIF